MAFIIFSKSSFMAAFLVVSLLISSSLLSLTSAFKGTATFYDPPYTPSACFDHKSKGNLVAAASDKIWDGGKICGKKFKVKCTGGTNGTPRPCIKGKTVTVVITDRCPDCNGTIDLSKDAYKVIGNIDAGKIKIDARQLH